MAHSGVRGLVKLALQFSARQEAALLTTAADACLTRPGALSLGVSGIRGFATQLHEVLEFTARRELFKNAATVSGLLPNRKEFAAQFSPHGITLVPRAILDKASGTVQHVETPLQASANPESSMVYASGKPSTDKTKMWRRMKIKKHKIRKRRKMNRHKSD